MSLPWVNLLLPMHRPSSLCPSAPSNKEPPSLASGHQYRRMHINTHTRYSLINIKKPSVAAEPSQSINHINQPLCRCPTPHPQMHSKTIKNITRIAKTALCKCPGKLRVNVNNVFALCHLFPFLPVGGISLQRQLSPQMTCLRSLIGPICMEVEGCEVNKQHVEVLTQ